jgi:hypothetical protein
VGIRSGFSQAKKRLNTPVVQALINKLELLNQGQIPGKNKVIRILFKATRLLFYELARELTE